MSTFRAYRIHRNDGRISARFDQTTLDDLTPGEVVVRVRYSDINYKDTLAATGGVGSLAVNMLAGRGYEVVALSGKADADDYLGAIGAARILRRQDLNLGAKPLEPVQWAGAIDNLGGDVLAWLTRTVDFWGNIASIGLAASHELHTTVMPFILRGVNLLWINSVATPRDVRLVVRDRIATDLRPRQLERISARVVKFDTLPAQFGPYIDGAITGRIVVEIS